MFGKYFRTEDPDPVESIDFPNLDPDPFLRFDPQNLKILVDIFQILFITLLDEYVA